VASLPPLSQGRLLFVRLQRSGDFIDLAIPPAVKPGTYLLKVRLVTSWDYGMVRVKFNETAVGQRVDTYSAKIETKWVIPGNVEVKSGQNVLRIEAAGRNPASAGHYAGVDAVMFVPVE
jgi:hypothetical protein